MKQRCIEAVAKAAGRTLTQAETQGIEERIGKHKRLLAMEDRNAYLGMTEGERLNEAAKRAAQEMVAEAAKKKQRVARTIEVHDQIDNYIAEQKKAGMKGFDALERYMAYFADFKNKGQSLESLMQAVTADYTRRLVEVFDTIGPKAFGLMQNKAGTRALVYETFGVDSSKIAPAGMAKAAKDTAKAWLDTVEEMRKHFNRLGGEIGKLEDWRFPQVHDQLKVAKAKVDPWVNDVLAMGLDRNRYVKTDGNLMNDAEIRAFLKEAWTSIATGGVNKREPGRAVGNSMRARRHAESRVLHFAEPEGFLAYQDKYGTDDVYSVMMGHVRTLAREIATLDKFGPNPDLMFDYWRERILKEDVMADPTTQGRTEARAATLENLFDYLTGRTQPVANRWIANTFDTLRSWIVATRMGSGYISSLPDNATMRLTGFVNNIPEVRLARNQLAALNPANRNELALARRAGLSLDTMMGEVNRWGTDAFGPRWSKKAANLTMRASGLNAATEARRRAFGVSMMGSVGSTVRRYAKLADIKTIDKRVLAGSGITEDIFQIWKLAELEDFGSGNDTMLTPESIYRIPDAKLAGKGNPAALRQDAALKLLGMVLDETNMAVVMPDARQRAWLASWRKGTWSGEIVASFMLFKGMPLAIVRKNWERGVGGMETKMGKAAYLAAFVAGTTVLGAVAQQIYEMVNGRDPKDMTEKKFWAAAMLKGGSLGIYGDFLFQVNSSYGNTPLAVLSGPVAGYAEDLIGLTQGSLVRAAQGKDTKFGPNAVRFIKNNIPLQNLWYTRAVTDRLIFNRLQELSSPGYLRRTEQRLKRDYGQKFWWGLDDAQPQRAPNLQRAVGG